MTKLLTFTQINLFPIWFPKFNGFLIQAIILFSLLTLEQLNCGVLKKNNPEIMNHLKDLIRKVWGSKFLNPDYSVIKNHIKN